MSPFPSSVSHRFASLTVRREVRATLVLALPLVLTQLTQMSMSFMDVVMVYVIRAIVPPCLRRAQ